MLLVCSKSTFKLALSSRDHFPKINRVRVVATAMTEEEVLSEKDSEDEVIAIGGGAVIDAAKIISRNPIVCYPTTAAGSASTSHSVYWKGSRKYSLKRQIPKEVHVVPELIRSLPEQAQLWTTYDAFSHCLDSMWSAKKTPESLAYVNEALSIIKSRPNVVDLVQAGNIAGKAIELVPTTILHSMSYPLTGFYKIPHGRALGYLLPQVARFMEFNISEYIEPPNILLPDIFSYTLAREALTYKKVYDTEKEINLEILMELYKHHG